MDKIAILIDTLEVGGVAKAALDFIRCLDVEGFDVTVYVREYSSVEKISYKPNAIYKPWSDEETLFSLLKKRTIERRVTYFWNKLRYYLHFRNHGKRIIDKARCRGKIKEQYDCVIGYQMVANDVTIMALEKIDAPRKLLWLHGQKNFSQKDVPFYDALYSKAYKIVCVSRDTEERFRSLMPMCSTKTITIHNCYNIAEILRLANEAVEVPIGDKSKVVIVSVGRISKEKGFDRVPEVAFRLKQNGYQFQWLIIGDGNCRSSVERRITELKLTNEVLLLGHLKNPYPYMKKCDIYVQPSYSEGYCTSTIEAKILDRPVVTTDVPGMNEQFESGKNGLIVESSIQGIFEGIMQLMDNPSLRNNIISMLMEENATIDINHEALEKTLQLFGEGSNG